MREPFGEGTSRAAPLRACANGFLGARAQRGRRTGDRAQESRSWPTYLLCSDSCSRHRAHAVSLDSPKLPVRLPARLCCRNVHLDSAEPGKPLVTPLAEMLRAEIERGGPIPFYGFMNAALYHPEHGYYRQARDPFGKDGDFFPAEQLQPVFGILIAARIRS